MRTALRRLLIFVATATATAVGLLWWLHDGDLAAGVPTEVNGVPVAKLVQETQRTLGEVAHEAADAASAAVPAEAPKPEIDAAEGSQ